MISQEARTKINEWAFSAAYSIANKDRLTDDQYVLLHALMDLYGNTGRDRIDGGIRFIIDAAVQTLLRGYEYSGEEDTPGIARMLTEEIRDGATVKPTPLRPI